MYATLGFVIIIIALITHELAHALEMRRKGIEIGQIGLGISIPRITYYFYDRWIFKCPIAISPILLMAYVMPSTDGFNKITTLNYKDQADIYGAGPWINFVLACILFILINIIEPSKIFTLYFIIPFSLMLIFKKIFCRYVLPIIGIITMIYVMNTIFQGLFGVDKLEDAVGGPVMIVKTINKFSTNLRTALLAGALISTSLGAFNAIPLGMLDGGKIITAAFQHFGKKIHPIFMTASYAIFFALITLALTSDMVKQ